MTVTTPGTVAPTDNNTNDTVTAWRTWVLLQAGYTPHDAHLLATNPNIDLHTAAYLAQAGCPIETALRILL